MPSALSCVLQSGTRANTAPGSKPMIRTVSASGDRWRCFSATVVSTRVNKQIKQRAGSDYARSLMVGHEQYSSVLLPSLFGASRTLPGLGPRKESDRVQCYGPGAPWITEPPLAVRSMRQDLPTSHTARISCGSALKQSYGWHAACTTIRPASMALGAGSGAPHRCFSQLAMVSGRRRPHGAPEAPRGA